MHLVDALKWEYAVHEMLPWDYAVHSQNGMINACRGFGHFFTKCCIIPNSFKYCYPVLLQMRFIVKFTLVYSVLSLIMSSFVVRYQFVSSSTYLEKHIFKIICLQNLKAATCQESILRSKHIRTLCSTTSLTVHTSLNRILLKILALAKGTYTGELPLNPKNSLLTNLSIMSIMGRWALKSFFKELVGPTLIAQQQQSPSPLLWSIVSILCNYHFYSASHGCSKRCREQSIYWGVRIF